MRGFAVALIAGVAATGLPLADASAAGPQLRKMRKQGPKLPKRKMSVERDLNEYRARSFGVVQTPELDEYLQGVVARLVEASELKGLSIHPHITAGNGFGAEVTPKGNLFIDIDTFSRVTDEDVLAGIIAHEMAHLLHGHASKENVKKRQKKMMMLSDLAITLNRESARSYGAKQVLSDKKTGKRYQDLAYRLNRDIVTPGWGRDQEIVADKLAVDLLAAAGYDPYALTDFLAFLVEQQAANKKAINRAKKLGAELMAETMREIAPETPSTGNEIGDIFVTAARNDMESKLAKSLAGLSKTHPDPGERMEVVARYLGKFHDPAKNPERSVAPFEGAVAVERTRIVLEHYAAAFELERQLKAGDAAELERLAGIAAAPPTHEDPYPLLVVSQLRGEQARPREAFQTLAAAFGGPEPSGRIVSVLAHQFLFDYGSADETAAVIESAWLRMDRAKALYPLLIQGYRRAGRYEDAAKIEKKCASVIEVERSCRVAARLAEQASLASAAQARPTATPQNREAATGDSDVIEHTAEAVLGLIEF